MHVCRTVNANVVTVPGDKETVSGQEDWGGFSFKGKM